MSTNFEKVPHAAAAPGPGQCVFTEAEFGGCSACRF